MKKQLTDELLIIHIQLGIIRYIENRFQPSQAHQIIQHNGERWRQRATELVHQIEEHEAWLEGERVHHHIDPHDPVIMNRVNRIIMEHLDEMRREII